MITEINTAIEVANNKWRATCRTTEIGGHFDFPIEKLDSVEKTIYGHFHATTNMRFSISVHPTDSRLRTATRLEDFTPAA